MGFRVEGVTEASLTSDMFVACLFQHSCRGGGGGGGGGRGMGGRSGDKKRVLDEECSIPRTAEVGWSGWTRPLTMGGGGGRH